MTQPLRASFRDLALAFALGGLAAAGCGGGGSPGAPAETVLSGRTAGPSSHCRVKRALPRCSASLPRGKKASFDARVVVYFLGPDLKAPLGNPPSGVTVSLRTPDATEPIAVPLSPDPKGRNEGKDAADPGRFASAVGPHRRPAHRRADRDGRRPAVYGPLPDAR